MLPWKIYYDDRTTFSCLDGPPEGAPPLGVLVINVFDPKHGSVNRLQRFDYYWWSPPYDCWLGGDVYGALDHLLHQNANSLKAGRMVSSSHWANVYQLALDDPDFKQ